MENTPKVHIGHKHKEFGKSRHRCCRSYCSSENQVEKSTDVCIKEQERITVSNIIK